MKRSTKIVIIVSSIILLSGSAYYWKERQTQEQLSFDRRVEVMMCDRDLAESGMMFALDEINRKLDSIRDSKGYLALNLASNYDGLGSKKEQIMNNIDMLDNIINNNITKINNLEERLDKMNSRNEALRNKVMTFGKRNQDALAELQNLKQQLTKEEEKLFEEQEKNIVLTEQVKEQSVSYVSLKTLYDKTENDAYTAYYITGSKKQLSDLNVIEQKRVPILNITFSKKAVTYFPSKEFEKIDVREEAIIPTHTKKAVLVTPHAKESYVWQEDEDGMKNLCITKPEVFWQSTKYLVVQTK